MPFIASKRETKLQSTISNIYNTPPLPFNEEKSLSSLLSDVLFYSSHHQSQAETEYDMQRMKASSYSNPHYKNWLSISRHVRAYQIFLVLAMTKVDIL